MTLPRNWESMSLDRLYASLNDRNQVVDGSGGSNGHDAEVVSDDSIPPPSGPEDYGLPALETEVFKNVERVSIDDFHAYMPGHSYIFTPSREMWPASSVNSRIPPQPICDPSGAPILDDKGKQKTLSASKWLDQNKAVEQMTWAPGLPEVIHDKLVSDGGWIDHEGASTFNLYRAPRIRSGDPGGAGMWVDHVRRIFPSEAELIILWLAHRVQRPQEKINYGIVLGGSQGIGKDTMLEPVKHAVGAWNFTEVTPQQLLGRFNGFVKSVIMRISEARDLGDISRYAFYEHLKPLMAAPPDVLRVDQKHIHEHAVFNVCGVILTTNYKTDGIYLPADDRRHFVCWSDAKKEEFTADYWADLWGWYHHHAGLQHVTAYLRTLDLSCFDPKAPPPKTRAFWDIVDASRAPEDAELADVLDEMENPDTVTLANVGARSAGSLNEWLSDRKNRRLIPYRMESCGYLPIHNDAAKDGLWKLQGKRQVIYARSDLSVADQLRAARALVGKEAADDGPY